MPKHLFLANRPAPPTATPANQIPVRSRLLLMRPARALGWDGGSFVSVLFAEPLEAAIDSLRRCAKENRKRGGYRGPTIASLARNLCRTPVRHPETGQPCHLPLLHGHEVRR